MPKIMTKIMPKIVFMPKTMTRSTMVKTMTNEIVPNTLTKFIMATINHAKKCDNRHHAKLRDKLTCIKNHDNIHRTNNRAKRNRDKYYGKITVQKTVTT